MTLLKSVDKKSANLAVIGMGYVGLPLAKEFALAGFSVIGIDVDSKRIRQLKKGVSYIDDISNKELKAIQKTTAIQFTDQYRRLSGVDIIIICVPTPLSKTKEPDLSYILSAVDMLSKYIRKGQLIVLESTTYPGTTDEHIVPSIESGSKLKVGKDISVAFSPERVDPANKNFKLNQIPKVVGGVDDRSKKLATKLYSHIFKEVVPVSSARTAEMVKLLENTFRSVNIGMINEMAMICDTLGIDVWEVIDAAKTKPFGFMPFYPGPGIGGHCINIDPMYLAWKVRLHGYEPKLIELAQSINDGMPQWVVKRIQSLLGKSKKSLDKSKLFIIGVSYKKNVRDTRESPAYFVLEELMRLGVQIKYHDPYVSEINIGGDTLKSTKLNKSVLKRQDCIIVLTDHDNVNYKLIADTKILILDTRNAFKLIKPKKNIYKL